MKIELTEVQTIKFWAKVQKTESCWIWNGRRHKGYGRFSIGNRQVKAHRISFNLLKGEFPQGLEPDHTCRNKLCVNPDHLDPVTHKENVRRGNGLAAINFRKTHCKHGHPFSSENTTVYKIGRRKGYRQCRACEKRHRKNRKIRQMN